MSLLSEFDEIMIKEDRIVKSTAIELHSQLVKVTPVDTSNLKSSWTAVRKTEDGYSFGNTENVYGADVIFRGLRTVNGRTYGSKNLPDGIQPFLDSAEIQLQKDLKGIK